MGNDTHVHQLTNRETQRKNVRTAEHSLAVKENELWPRAATWMNPEDLMVNERSQMQKSHRKYPE